MQERSSFNGRVKEKRRELGPDLHTGKGAVKRRKIPTLWEDLTPVGRSARTERELQRLRECNSQLSAGSTERLAERIHATLSVTQPKMCAC